MRRIRTNTPTAALVTLNDPVFVEASQAFARRVHESATSDETRLRKLFQHTLARTPSPSERDRLIGLLESERTHFAKFPDEAVQAATDPLGPLAENMPAEELAAWSVVCQVVINLHEFLTRP